MKILLINTNPVVSRLLALCTRDEAIVLDEVVGADAVKKTSYDIVFVDEVSYVNDVQALLETLKSAKKVFISYAGETVAGFDKTVKKPFLPSQIITLIESTPVNDADEKEENDVSEEELSISPMTLENEEALDDILPDIFPLPAKEDENSDIPEPEENAGPPEVLDRDEIEKIKALLDMDEEIAEDEDMTALSSDEYEARKVKVIKEQLIAEGLDIVDEEKMVEELSHVAADETEGTGSGKGRTKKKREEKRELSEEELSRVEAAIMATLSQMKPKKIKKLLKGKETKIKIKLEDDQ